MGTAHIPWLPLSLVDHHPKIYDFPLDLWGTCGAVLIDRMAIDVLMEEMGLWMLLVSEKLFCSLLLFMLSLARRRK
jgi:hypothetical protein